MSIVNNKPAQASPGEVNDPLIHLETDDARPRVTASFKDKKTTLELDSEKELTAEQLKMIEQIIRFGSIAKDKPDSDSDFDSQDGSSDYDPTEVKDTVEATPKPTFNRERKASMMAAMSRKFTDTAEDVEKIKKFNMMAQVFPRLQDLADKQLINKLDFDNVVSIPNKFFGQDFDLKTVFPNDDVTKCTSLVAVCCGISDYSKVEKMKDLENCIADSFRIKRALETLDFKVSHHIECGLEDLEQIFSDLEKDADNHCDNETDVCYLFYASCHGMMIDGAQHLLMNMEDMTTFPIELKLRQLAERERAKVIGVFDCCREKAAAKGEQSVVVTDADDIILCYGCAPALGVSAESKISELFVQHMLKKATVQGREGGWFLFPDDMEDMVKTIPDFEVSAKVTKKFAVQFKHFFVSDKVDGFVADKCDRRGPYLLEQNQDDILNPKQTYLDLKHGICVFGKSATSLTSYGKKKVTFASIEGEEAGVTIELDESKGLYELKIATTFSSAVNLNGRALSTEEKNVFILNHGDEIEIKDKKFRFNYPLLSFDFNQMVDKIDKNQLTRVAKAFIWLLIKRTGLTSYNRGMPNTLIFSGYTMQQIYSDLARKEGNIAPAIGTKQDILGNDDELAKKLGITDQKVVKFDKKIAIIFAISDYSKNDKYDDLPNCIFDGKRMEKNFKNLGFEVRKPDCDPKALLKWFRGIPREQEGYIKDKKKVCWAFYVSAHGVMKDGTQHIVLNATGKTFPIEQKIRALLSCNNAFAIALFDCCREILLQRGSAEGGPQQEIVGGFTFLYGCAPGAGVNADSKFSYRLMDLIKTKAAQRGSNYCVLPSDLADISLVMKDAECKQQSTHKFVLELDEFLASQQGETEEDFIFDGVDRRRPHITKLGQQKDGKSQTFEYGKITFGKEKKTHLKSKKDSDKDGKECPNVDLEGNTFINDLASITLQESGLFVFECKNANLAQNVYINGKSRYDPANKGIVLKHGDYIAFGESNLFVFKYPMLNMAFKKRYNQHKEALEALEVAIDLCREKTHAELDYAFKKVQLNKKISKEVKQQQMRSIFYKGFSEQLHAMMYNDNAFKRIEDVDTSNFVKKLVSKEKQFMASEAIQKKYSDLDDFIHHFILDFFVWKPVIEQGLPDVKLDDPLSRVAEDYKLDNLKEDQEKFIHKRAAELYQNRYSQGKLRFENRGWIWDYTGQITDNKANGFGWATNTAGMTYCGFWQNNNRHGSCQFYCSAKSHFCAGMNLTDSVWRDDKCDEIVLIAGADDEGDFWEYKGPTKKGVANTGESNVKGFCVSSNGWIYEGQMAGNFKHGDGILIYNEHKKKQDDSYDSDEEAPEPLDPRYFDSYECSYVKEDYQTMWEKRNSDYYECISDAEKYKKAQIPYAAGTWKDDELVDGFGRIFFRDSQKKGWWYQGPILEGNLQKDGFATDQNDVVYEGEWQGQLKHGRGFYIVGAYTAQPGKIRGEWVNDKDPDTYSQIIIGKGVFRGQVNDFGNANGYGVWVDEHSYGQPVKYFGEWRRNRFDGLGTFVFGNEWSYTGKFRFHKKSGEGVLTDFTKSESDEKRKIEQKWERGIVTVKEIDQSRKKKGHF